VFVLLAVGRRLPRCLSMTMYAELPVSGGSSRPPSYLLSISKLLENPKCVKDLAEPMNSNCRGQEAR